MSSAGSHSGLLIYCFLYFSFLFLEVSRGGGLPLNWYPLKTREDLVRSWVGRCRSGVICTIILCFFFAQFDYYLIEYKSTKCRMICLLLPNIPVTITLLLRNFKPATKQAFTTFLCLNLLNLNSIS